MKKYYVYTWTRLDLNIVFYVGKGSGSRYKDRSMRNRYFNNVVEKVGIDNIRIDIIEDNLEEQEAFEREIYYIEYYQKLVGDKLTNLTKGGEGSSNWFSMISEEEKERHREISRSFLGRNHTEETKRKISESHKGQKLSEETKKKISKHRKENPREGYWKGKSLSEETKRKISETRKERGIKNPNSKTVLLINSKCEVLDSIESRAKTFIKYTQYKQHIIKKSLETNSKVKTLKEIFFIEQDKSFIYEKDYNYILSQSTIETISLNEVNENNGVEYIQGEIPCLEVRGV